MSTYADKTQENNSRTTDDNSFHKHDASNSTLQFVDKRLGAVTQRKLQEMANNTPTPNQVVQLLTGKKITKYKNNPSIAAIFEQRIADGTATTGKHNYAIDLDTNEIKRSTVSGHAEILLVMNSQAQEGQTVNLLSEYKPCGSCQEHIQGAEFARTIDVNVNWMLNYQDTGDGDVGKTREFYKSRGWLSGGGNYNYQVTYDQ